MNLGPNAKAIVAFVSLLITNLLANVVVAGHVVPQDLSEWAVAVLTTLAGTFAVWSQANKPPA